MASVISINDVKGSSDCLEMVGYTKDIRWLPESPRIYYSSHDSSWVLASKMRCFQSAKRTFQHFARKKKKSTTPKRWSDRISAVPEVKGDLEMLRNDGLGPEDPQTALKQRLLDLTKKNRRLQVTVDGQRARLQQLEIEVKKPKEEAKKQAEEISCAMLSCLVDGLNQRTNYRNSWRFFLFQKNTRVFVVSTETKILGLFSPRKINFSYQKTWQLS